jgi:hypothetical protein
MIGTVLFHKDALLFNVCPTCGTVVMNCIVIQLLQVSKGKQQQQHNNNNNVLGSKILEDLVIL